MDDSQDRLEERVSALVDGQLSGEEFARTMADLQSCPLARSQWDTYHVVGDAMRSRSAAVQLHDGDFVQRLRQRIFDDALKNEAVNQEMTRAEGQFGINFPSANDKSWRLVAGFAAAAMFALVAWQGLRWTSSPGSEPGPLFATREAVISTPAASPVLAASTGLHTDSATAMNISGESTVMIRDPRLDALLAAHRQFGGASALQMPSGFMRNATFEDGGR